MLRAMTDPRRSSRELADRRVNLIHRVALDAALAEVSSALSERGLRSVLLKGPALATWLYDDPSERTYTDVDLLVDPSTFARAEAVLAELGFRQRGYQVSDWHVVWFRAGTLPIEIELHRALSWTRCPDERVWRVLGAGTDRLEVAGATVEIPRVAARLLVVALHAAHHGGGWHRTLADLERALGRASTAEWEAAAELARELEAIEPFAAGLRLVPGGAALAESLGLAAGVRREVALWLVGPELTTIGFEQFLAAPRLRDRLRLVARQLVPTPALLRAWQPLARRGALGLAAAYAWRPLWVLWKSPGGYRAWRRARAALREGAPPATG